MTAQQSTASEVDDTPFDARKFRDVLGHLPTGVVVITAVSDGLPAGMAVGSFSSVSLNPPLVAFLPDKSSTTFPAIRQSGSFCVNVLSARQEFVCRAFATRGGDKFRGLSWTPAGTGSPILDGAVAWIDCDIEEIHEAGDHYIVLGRVRDLDVQVATIPLLFFQGGYGGFAPTSLAMGATTELLEPLRIADRARDQMELVATAVDADCHAHAVSGNQVVVVASAYPAQHSSTASRIGMRFPLVPPWGEVFLAWSSPEEQATWVESLGKSIEPDQREAIVNNMRQIRAIGWAFTVRSDADADVDALLEVISRLGHTPATERELGQLIAKVGHRGNPDQIADLPAGSVRTVSAPVFGPTGDLVLMLSLHNLPRDRSSAELEGNIQLLRDAAQAVTDNLAVA